MSVHMQPLLTWGGCILPFGLGLEGRPSTALRQLGILNSQNLAGRWAGHILAGDDHTDVVESSTSRQDISTEAGRVRGDLTVGYELQDRRQSFARSAADKGHLVLSHGGSWWTSWLASYSPTGEGFLVVPPGLTMPSRCCSGPGQLSSRSDRVMTAAAAFGAITHGQLICTATSNALLGVSTGLTLLALHAGAQKALVRWDADPRCSMPMLRIFMADTASERCFALVSALEALLDLVPPLNNDCSVCSCSTAYKPKGPCCSPL